MSLVSLVSLVLPPLRLVIDPDPHRLAIDEPLAQAARDAEQLEELDVGRLAAPGRNQGMRQRVREEFSAVVPTTATHSANAIIR